MKALFPRHDEKAELNAFADSESSGFLYVRGRRRVGKSWLLVHWSQRRKDTLYFSGKKDTNKKETLQQFIQAWAEFSKAYSLLEIRPELLSWDRIFSEIIKHQKEKKTKMILIFDEVQWIAKEG